MNTFQEVKYRRGRIEITKGEHRYIFRGDLDNPGSFIDAFATSAADHNSDFDWFDAAVLSYRLGRFKDYLMV